MTRAVLSLIAGNLGDAALYNPFCFFLLFMVIASIAPARLQKQVPARFASFLPYGHLLILVLVIAFWIFDRLLPHWGI
jgi:hypothetical protein